MKKFAKPKPKKVMKKFAKPKPKKVSESPIEKKCRTLAKLKGYEPIKQSKGQGWPDRLFIGEDDVFFVEFKASDGVLSPLQKRRITFLRKCNIEVHVVRSVSDFEEIVRFK